MYLSNIDTYFVSIIGYCLGELTAVYQNENRFVRMLLALYKG